MESSEGEGENEVAMGTERWELQAGGLMCDYSFVHYRKIFMRSSPMPGA